MDLLSWIVGGIAMAVLIAWYVSYGAARLDRLHTRVEGALSVLDAQLVRRAEATLELANCGALDAASALILAGAAIRLARGRHRGSDGPVKPSRAT